MRQIRLSVLAMLLIWSGLLWLPGEAAFACSCVGGDAAEKLQRSAAVFTGKVVDIGGTKKFMIANTRKYTFEVEHAWKGVEQRQITVYSYDGSSASCGYEFKRNQTYLVYAYVGIDSTELQTNLCSGNLLLSEAGADLQLLNGETGAIAGDQLPEVEEETGSNWILYMSIAVLLAAVGFWIARRRFMKGRT